MLKKSIIMTTITLCLLTGGMAQVESRPELRVGTANISSTIDPGRDHSNVGAQNYYNLFDALIHKDHSSIEPRFYPALATSWEYISDTVLELKLREGVRFHNGDVMTAEDVKFSFDRLLEGDFPPYVSIYEQFFTTLERVDIVDSLTVRVVTKQADPALLSILSTTQASIVPKDYVEAVGYEAFAEAPIGTGPLRLTEFRHGELMVWEAFDDHWGPAVNVSRVTLRRIPELSARVTALINGEVDLITNIPPDQVQAIDSAPNYEVREILTPIFHVIFYNTKYPPLSDVKLRQALNLAIDRQLLVDALWDGKASVPRGHQFPQYGELYNPDYPLLEYDLERARQLLEESSYNGETIVYQAPSVYYTNSMLAAQAVTEMWRELGINTEIAVDQPFDDDVFMVRAWSNPMYFADPAGSYGTMWSPTGARVPRNWEPAHPDYESIYNEFRFSLDPEVRREAFERIMQIAEEEAPFTILYQPVEYYGIRANISWEALPGHQPYTLDFRDYNLKFEAQAGR